TARLLALVTQGQAGVTSCRLLWLRTWFSSTLFESVDRCVCHVLFESSVVWFSTLNESSTPTSVEFDVSWTLCETVFCWSPCASPATESAPPPDTDACPMSALFAAPEPNAVVLWSPLTTSLPSPCTLPSPRMLF